MARAVTKKASRTTGKKAARAKTTRKTAAKKAAPRKSTAKVRATPAAAVSRIPRVIAADGRRVRGAAPRVVPPVKAPKLTPKLTVAERVKALAAQLYVNDEEYDTSRILVDYQKLRQAGIRAMGGDIEAASPEDIVQVEGVNVVKGSYATKAKGTDLAKQIKDHRKGSGVVFRVHLLDFHVLEGESRVNWRDFSSPDMIQRVAEMTFDVSNNGIHEPAKASIRSGLLAAVAGETRWRAAVHAWIYKADGKLENAPETIPVILLNGQNDAELQMVVLKQNDQKNMKTLEMAAGIRRTHHVLGKPVNEIASFMNRSVSWVNGMIGYMEMPEQVQTMIRTGDITVNFAAKAWEQEGHDPGKTIRAIEQAKRVAKATDATRVMPRHLVKSDDAPAAPETTSKAASNTNTEEHPDTVTETAPKVRTSNMETQRDRLIRQVDAVALIINNLNIRDNEDGTYDLCGVTQSQMVELKTRLGTEIPASALDVPDDEPATAQPDVTDETETLRQDEAALEAAASQDNAEAEPVAAE